MHDLEKGHSGQLTWITLSQGFKNSPTTFDEPLYEDLGEYWRGHPQVTLLHYVDNILIAADTEEDCKGGTGNLLTTLETLGYWASAEKPQICQTEVTYLGYMLKGGQRWLSEAHKKTVFDTHSNHQEGN